MSHTPGPWTLSERRKSVLHDGKCVAECDTAFIFEEQRLANAALIAAAPDLLEAADLAVHFILAPLSAGSAPEPQMIKKAHEMVFAAIAKARGE
jgi:hypothetical protein